MKTIGNILWVILVGWGLALGYFITGLLCCVTIFFIPVGLQLFKFARLAFWPFGTEIIYTGRMGKTLINILWAILFGWELALTNIITGAVLCCTIIGIPFGLQVFKFAKLSFFPLGAVLK